MSIASSFLCFAIADEINGTSATENATFILNGIARRISTLPDKIPYFALAVIISYLFYFKTIYMFIVVKKKSV